MEKRCTDFGFLTKVSLFPLVCRPDEAAEVSSNMLGHKLITKQTGAAGRPCNAVFVVERVDLAREFYFAILYDRHHQVRIGIAIAIGSGIGSASDRLLTHMCIGPRCCRVVAGRHGH